MHAEIASVCRGNTHTHKPPQMGGNKDENGAPSSGPSVSCMPSYGYEDVSTPIIFSRKSRVFVAFAIFSAFDSLVAESFVIHGGPSRNLHHVLCFGAKLAK